MIQKKQFKGISLWGFRDSYSINLPTKSENLKDRVSNFYQSRKAKKTNVSNLSFERGSRLWTWLNFWSELWPYQSIHVIKENNFLSISYEVHGGIWLRFPPYHFEREVNDLEEYLSKN